METVGENGLERREYGGNKRAASRWRKKRFCKQLSQFERKGSLNYCYLLRRDELDANQRIWTVNLRLRLLKSVSAQKILHLHGAL